MKLEEIPFYNPFSKQIECNLRALRDLVFVYEEPLPEKFEGTGIVIPDEYREDYRYAKGYVISVGKGYYDEKGKFHPTEVKVGDYILFDKTVLWSKIKAKTWNGEEYDLQIMGEKDIFGYVEESKE